MLVHHSWVVWSWLLAPLSMLPVGHQLLYVSLTAPLTRSHLSLTQEKLRYESEDPPVIRRSIYILLDGVSVWDDCQSWPDVPLVWVAWCSAECVTVWPQGRDGAGPGQDCLVTAQLHPTTTSSSLYPLMIIISDSFISRPRPPFSSCSS